MPPVNNSGFITGKDVLYNTRAWRKPIREILRRAYDAHCGLRLTNSQHVIITSDANVSTTVAASPHGLAAYKRDTQKVIDAQRGWDAEHTKQEPAVTAAPTATGQATSPTPTKPSVRTSDSRPEVIHCPACKPSDPGFVQLTIDQLQVHLEAIHVQCPEPTCRAWVRSRNGLPGHKAIKHSGAEPWRYRADAKNPLPRPDDTDAPVAPPADPTAPTVVVPDDILEHAAAAGRAAAGAGTATRRPRRIKGHAIQDVQLPDDVASLPGRSDAIVAEFRRLLGDDPRVAQLTDQLAAVTAELDAWKRRAEDAETRVAMMKAAVAQVSAAADL